MTFAAPAESYDAFMGRYSVQLSPLMAAFAGVQHGQTAVDVGCGPGALTAELVRRLGARAVAAVDPAAQFVAAARARNPGVEIVEASAEALPFTDRRFDAALAQLVVHFMQDPVAGIAEMARVTKVGGVVAASVWDYAGERSPLSVFWHAARELDPGIEDESGLAGARQGHLAELFAQAGLSEIEETTLTAEREHANFDEWWQPYLRTVGPAGTYLAGLSPDRRVELREKCRSMLPASGFVLTFVAWAARGRPAG